jgi:hypothetical protein
VKKSEGKRPLRKQKFRWVKNIKMNLDEIRWGDVAWTDLAQDRDLVNMVVNLGGPTKCYVKFFNSCIAGCL